MGEVTSGTPGRVFQAAAFEVGNDYCRYGHPSSWNWEKRQFCCSLHPQEIDAWHRNFRSGIDFCQFWGFATSVEDECDKETGPKSPMCPMAGCGYVPPGCVIKREFYLTQDGCCPKLCNFVDAYGNPCGQDWQGMYNS